jgi:hypothetical protein
VEVDELEEAEDVGGRVGLLGVIEHLAGGLTFMAAKRSVVP